MEIRYYKEYSHHLNRDMEFKIYGHAGRPVLVFPCQGGRFFDFEDRKMHELAAPWIDSGRMQMICVDSIDKESWDNNGPARPRIEMHERWFNYIIEELIPRFHEINGGQYMGQIIAAGCSMGASHAVNYFLRRPDVFNGTIAMSGCYRADMFFGDYMDDLVYANSPLNFLPLMPNDHPHIALYNQAQSFIVSVGQGAWEDELLASTRELKDVLASKGINAWIDIWGTDVIHDWPWWMIQWPYFLGHVLG